MLPEKNPINCEIEQNRRKILKDSVILEISRTCEVPANPVSNPSPDPVPPTQTTGATFPITSA